MPSASSRRTAVFTRVAIAFALLASCFSDAQPVAAPCPRHVQSLLTSRQYDDCLTHLGARAAVSSSTPFAFTPANAPAIHANVHCVRALNELLAVAPPEPCSARLSDIGDERVLVEAEQLHRIANHPSSKQAAITRQLASGGSMLYHVRYSCQFETKHPFNADTDMTEDFAVWCRENMLIEYPSFWTWVGYIALGLVGVALVALLFVHGVPFVKRAWRRATHTNYPMNSIA